MLAFLDGEMDAAEQEAFALHLAGCDECGAELDRLRADAALFSGAVALIEAPVRVEAALGRVRREHAQRRAHAVTRRLLPYAATLVLGVAGIASATVPGSPVYGWPGAVLERIAGGTSEEAPTPAAPAVAEAVPAEAGVSILPAEGAVRIVVRGADPGLQVRARLVRTSQAEVVAAGAAADARFQTGAGTVTVVGPGPGELRLDLPESATRITVEINGLPYLSREGDQLRLHRPAMDAAGGELRFEVGRAAPPPAP